MCGPLLAIRLDAADLWSKFGFNDGSPFEFEDLGAEHDDDPPHADWMLLDDRSFRDDLLERLIVARLLPLIEARTGERPEIVRWGGHHNPVRDARYRAGEGAVMPASWAGIAAEVSPEDIRSEARQLAA